MKPRIKEPEDPAISKVLKNLDTKVAVTQDWEAAFRITFGELAYEEAYHCVSWDTPPEDWAGDASKFAAAFSLADRFVGSVMHRLFPFQYREMIPSLTHALMSWSWRREEPLPRNISEADVVRLLNYASYDNMAEWLEEQQ